MKIRLCDSCGLEIENRKEFIKACKSIWNPEFKTQQLIHIGDICIECWDKLTENRPIKRPNLSGFKQDVEFLKKKHKEGKI